MSQNPASGTTNSTLYHLEDHGEFIMRHIAPRDEQVQSMLDVIGVSSLDELIRTTLPPSIQIDEPLDLPDARTGAVIHRPELVDVERPSAQISSPAFWCLLSSRYDFVKVGGVSFSAPTRRSS